MTTVVQVTFRNIRVSPALDLEIRSRAAWLESFCPRIIGCQVLVEIPHRRRKHGRPLHVRIRLSLRGENVVVSHEPTFNAADRPAPRKRDELDTRHKDAHVAIQEAFDVARRRLEDMTRRQRGDVKTHSAAT
jgi:ribosome-associated translation inhibitor RaiA